MEFRTNIIGMMRTLLPFQVTVKPYALSTAPFFARYCLFMMRTPEALRTLVKPQSEPLLR